MGQESDALADSIITETAIRNTISALAHDSMMGRESGSPQALKAASFIAESFIRLGLQPALDKETFFSTYAHSLFGQISVGANVVANLIGNVFPDSVVVFCAHYDHIGILQNAKSRDSVYNGANDNASGVAALIELAKYYKARGDNKYSLYFIAFSGEEVGHVGSTVWANMNKQLPIKAVINFDMIGRSLWKGANKCMLITDDYKGILKKIIGKKRSGFFVPDIYPKEFLYTRSDHYSFVRYCKTIVFFTCTDPKDHHYHQVTDEINTIDFEFLPVVVRKIAVACTAFTK